MIYTVTLNPALDYVLEIPSFNVGEINRSKKEYILPGGKGINVSIILKELGIESTTLGFVAGFVGKEIEKMVQKYGIKTDFINIENDISRINVKITTPLKETAINGTGPYIDEKNIKLLYKKIEMIQKGDTLVLSGHIPKGVTDDIYQNICEKVKKEEIKLIVDTTGELLTKTLQYQPFLIKPNQEELGEIFNVKISSQEEVAKYAKKLQQKGAKNVLVSMGENGSVLLDENGNCYKMNPLNMGKRINSVGAGDSMIAGFIAGYQLFYDYKKALHMGVAAGTATASSSFLATREEIYKIFEHIVVT